MLHKIKRIVPLWVLIYALLFHWGNVGFLCPLSYCPRAVTCSRNDLGVLPPIRVLLTPPPAQCSDYLFIQLQLNSSLHIG